MQKNEQATEKRQGERRGGQKLEPWDSDIAHAAIVLTGNVTHAPSEQFGGVNKVSFMEEMQQGWANIAQFVVARQLCQ